MLCVVVLLCWVGMAFGQICNTSNFTGSPSMPPPSLPTQFSVVIELNIGSENRASDIKEYVDEVGNRGRLEISSTNFRANTVVGIFDYGDGEIYLIPDINNTGDACAVKPIATPGPFFPITLGFQVAGRSIRIETINRFFQAMRTASIRWVGVEDVRGIPCNRWQTCTVMQSYSYTLDYYFATDDWEFALGDAPTPVQMVLNFFDASEYLHLYHGWTLDRLLRNSSTLALERPVTRSNAYQSSFFPDTIALWNSLPSSVQNCQSLDSFKQTVLCHTLNTSIIPRGNRTPGSCCNAAVASPSEANYCNSFQLTHMPRGSVDREQWRPKGRQDSTHNLASTVSFGM